MNIYEKLSKVRLELQSMNLVKSGKNQTMAYFELGDFLPHINSLCNKNKMLTQFNIIKDSGIEKATLTIFNAEEPGEKITFVCPTDEASLPKGQAIQNLGAKITYMRRYMLLTAFEVVEADMVDKFTQATASEMAEEDLTFIKESPNMTELKVRVSELKKKYRVSVIAPIYEAVKKDLLDEEDIVAEGNTQK